MQIIFHIGQQKTASTAIQSLLAHNRKRLAAQGVLYPLALGGSKATLISDVATGKRSLGGAGEQILANLRAEMSGGHSRVIVSNENLFGGGRLPKTPRALKETFADRATSWRVLCYLRRPDEHLASLYQQNVKGGLTLPLEAFFEERLNGSYYSYARRLEQWAEVFGEDAVEVRLFHRATLKGSPFEDFAQWLGLDPASLSLDGRVRANESLDRLNTETLRLVNLLHLEQPDRIRGRNKKRIMARLRALDTGERLRLDGERARRLHERFREDHERLAARYLSAGEAAILLAPPAETPPPPPLDPAAISERMTALFGDPDLARLAVEAAGRPVDQSRVPKDATAKKRAKSTRALRQYERGTKLRYALVRLILEGSRLVRRAAGAAARALRTGRS